MNEESQKINILAMKLSSLRNELKASREVANSASLQVDKMFLEKNEEVKYEEASPATGETSENIQTEQVGKPERHPPQDPIINPDTKKAFRKIALRLHPDKLIDLPEGLEKNNKRKLYQRATKALEDEDLITLASITIELGMTPPKIPEEYIKKATDEINTIKKEIKHIESTYVWQWFFCYNKEEKKQLLEKMFELIYERNKKNNPGA